MTSLQNLMRKTVHVSLLSGPAAWLYVDVTRSQCEDAYLAEKVNSLGNVNGIKVAMYLLS